jgi:hypothetical protein
MYAARKKAGGEIKPESRLHAMWPGVFLLPVGLVIFGLMIRFHDLKNSDVGACIAMATTCFAVQVITTPVHYLFLPSFSMKIYNFVRPSHMSLIATTLKQPKLFNSLPSLDKPWLSQLGFGPFLLEIKWAFNGLASPMPL